MSEAGTRRHSTRAGEPRAASDYFDRARSIASVALIMAAIAAIAGSLLDWVTIVPPPGLRPGADFGGAPVEAPVVTLPFSGLEAGDGRWVIGAGVVLLVAAILLVLRRRSFYAWIGLLASVVIGSIAFADFRAIGDSTSSLSRRMDIVGDARPAAGIVLVAIGALVGLVASAAGVAASPRDG